MNLHKMIADAYGHFLNHCPTNEQSKPIFERYAKEELNLPVGEIPGFIRPVEIEDEDEISSQTFDRFYTWYFINYMANSPNDFTQKLNELAGNAIKYISERVDREKKITLFGKSENEEEDGDQDVFDEIPDFAYYDKYNYAQWAAIKEIRKEEDGRIEIDGILKGENYPDKRTITLAELTAEGIIYLADYLSKEPAQ